MPKKKKPDGRAKARKSPEAKRERLLRVRCTAAEEEAIKEVAELLGLTLSDYVVTSAIGRRLPASPGRM
jgi:uncharacterized protein (DUF1778 family)